MRRLIMGIIVGTAALLPVAIEARTVQEVEALCEGLDSKTLEAAIAGDVEARAIVGHLLVNEECGSDPARIDMGIKWLAEAVDAGEIDAMVSLALMYQIGRVVPKDTSRAEKFYRLAAEADVVGAQHALGVLLVSRGTEESRSEGLFWLGSAATNGDALSAIAIGMFHARGMHGVRHDACLALDWYEAGDLLSAPFPVAPLVNEIPDSQKARC